MELPEADTELGVQEPSPNPRWTQASCPRLNPDHSSASFQLDRVFVEVFHTSPNDGAELDKVIVPVVLGPRIMPG